MREFGYYVLFKGGRNKGDHCGTTTLSGTQLKV